MFFFLQFWRLTVQAPFTFIIFSIILNNSHFVPHNTTVRVLLCVSCVPARRSWEISATGCGYPKPAGWFSSSRVAAPPSPPFAGDDARRSREMTPPFAGDDAAIRGSPRPAVRGRSRRRPAADSMPAGQPLTQARWIAADSSPPDSR